MRVFCRILIVLGAMLVPCLAIAAEKSVESAPKGALVVASLMYPPVKWDKDANQRNLDAAIREAHNEGAQLVVTPEGALEGYLENEVRLTTGQKRRELVERFNRIAEPLDGPHIRHFQRLCKELRVFLVLGLLERDKDKTHNSAILIGPDGKIVGTYRKTHFAQGYTIGDEKGNNPAGYLRGDEYPVFDVAGRKLGIMICFDRRVSKVARRLARNGADVIVNPSYGKDGDCNLRYISARAKENGVPVLFVHPFQTVFSTSKGEIRVDARPKEGDRRVCLVVVDPPARR